MSKRQYAEIDPLASHAEVQRIKALWDMVYDERERKIKENPDKFVAIQTVGRFDSAKDGRITVTEWTIGYPGVLFNSFGEEYREVVEIIFDGVLDILTFTNELVAEKFTELLNSGESPRLSLSQKLTDRNISLLGTDL